MYIILILYSKKVGPLCRVKTVFPLASFWHIYKLTICPCFECCCYLSAVALVFYLEILDKRVCYRALILHVGFSHFPTDLMYISCVNSINNFMPIPTMTFPICFTGFMNLNELWDSQTCPINLLLKSLDITIRFIPIISFLAVLACENHFWLLSFLSTTKT